MPFALSWRGIFLSCGVHLEPELDNYWDAGISGHVSGCIPGVFKLCLLKVYLHEDLVSILGENISQEKKELGSEHQPRNKVSVNEKKE